MKRKNRHDFVGAGIFSFCKKCGELILSLGIPQRPCKPKVQTTPNSQQL